MRVMLDDARLALRGMRKNPAYAAVAVATLALAIGANTAVFSVVHSVLLRPLDYPEPDRLVRVYTARPEKGWLRMTVSFPDFNDWRERNTSFADMGIFAATATNYTGGDSPQRLIAVQASSSMLRTLGLNLQLGRGFTPEQDRPGGEQVVLLTNSFWRRAFGADPTIVGRTILLDDLPHTVLGVLPSELERAWSEFDLMTPLPFDAEQYGRGWRHFRVFARLRPGVSLEKARADMDRVAAGLAEDYPRLQGYGANVVPVAEVAVGAGARSTLFLLVAAVGFVLLIACANIANLLLAKGNVRQGEFALRAALGANRWRIVRQMITEGLVVALAAAVLGLLFASWGVHILVAGISDIVARTDAVAIDRWALAFTLALSLLTAVVFSIMPALRCSGSQPLHFLHNAVRGSTGGQMGRMWRDALIVGQVALALALVVVGGQMIRSLIILRSVEPGFDTERLATVQVQLPADRYATDTDRVQFYRDALERLRALPGVTAAGATSSLPMVGDDGDSWVLIEGYEGPEQGGGIFVGDVIVTPGYFEAMGVPVMRGRSFTEADDADAPHVMIVNQHMAELAWPGLDPIGRRVRFGSAPSDPWFTVIGVVGNVRQVALNEDVRFETYRPVAQEPTSYMALLARTPGDPLAAVSSIRSAIWEVDPNLAVFGERSMAEIRAANSEGIASITWLLAVFGAIAVILAAAGLYGVMSYVVSWRTREIGIRVALGARTPHILHQVVGHALLLTLLGIAAGFIIAFAMSGVLESLLFGVARLDAITFASVACLLVVVGVVASYVPARHAAAIQPVTALRQE